MKKTILSLMAAACVLVACEKENDDAIPADQLILTKNKTNDKRLGCDDVDNRRWTDYFKDCDCTHVGNCMRDVDVEGYTERIASIGGIFNVINSTEATLIQTTFQAHYDLLDGIIGTTLLNEVIAGTSRVEMKENQALSKKFMLFYNSSDELIRVHPFQF